MTTSIDPEAELSSEDPCRMCGFRPDSLEPSDAMGAVRLFPRRFAELLAGFRGEEGEDALGRRLEGSGWSALEHAGHVRDVLHALDMRLQRVLRDDHPPIPETPRTPPVGANDQGRDLVLASMRFNAENMARTLSSLADHDWSRAGVRAGTEVRALDLAREAVHEGAHHLRMVERGLPRPDGRRPLS